MGTAALSPATSSSARRLFPIPDSQMIVTSTVRHAVCARPHVHDRAGHQQLAGGADARGGLARLDTDPDLERLGEAGRLSELAGPISNREAGADGPQGVVLVHVWQAEDRHHSIPDELLR